MYLEVSSKKKVNACYEAAIVSLAVHFIVRLECIIHKFTEVNFRDFVVGPLVQSSRTPVC